MINSYLPKVKFYLKFLKYFSFDFTRLLYIGIFVRKNCIFFLETQSKDFFHLMGFTSSLRYLLLRNWKLRQQIIFLVDRQSFHGFLCLQFSHNCNSPKHGLLFIYVCISFFHTVLSI